MATKEMYVIERADNRQAQIEALDIGDSVSIARRILMDYGIPKETISTYTEKMRGILDQQVHRARRRLKDRKYTVENGAFITRGGAVILTAVVTRTE